MELLKRKRGGYKSVITRFIGKMTEVIDSTDIDAIPSLRDSILDNLNKVLALDEQILDLVKEEMSDEMINQAEYARDVRTHICKHNSSITNNLKVLNPLMQPPPLPTASIRLPKLDLQHYSGDILGWNSFWELCDVSVHQRKDLEPIQKFPYLRSLLTGEASKLISGFKFEAANYPQAVALLLSIYGKRDEIKHVLVRRLLEMESPAASSESFQTFRANFECSIRSLESERLELNELYAILLYTKLPQSVSETVKRRSGDD
ncbi:uncharacterized protein [Palaemon carinicauda]|uniref:uncharacterized protein n=1 Tax=Palaemon carinicauda TaxID=392227 RepID=UPI0035B5A148